MTTDILTYLFPITISTSIAILVVLALRNIVRSTFGSSISYALWLIVPIAVVASLMPAEFIFVDREGGQQTVAVTLAPTEAIDTLTIAPSPSSASPAKIVPSGTTLWVMSIWLAGFIASLSRLIYQQNRFSKALNLKAVSGHVHMANDENTGPVVIGVIKPRIVVPGNFEALYSEREQSLILAHEQSHISIGDTRINAAAFFIKCLNWFNPLAHIAYKVFRIDQELACDERVMRNNSHDRRIYAEALLKSQLMGQTAPLGCAWVPNEAHPLKQRIARLATPALTSTRQALGVIVLGVAVSMSGATAWASLSSKTVHISNDRENTVSDRGENKTSDTLSDAQGAALANALLDGRDDHARALIEAGANVDYFLGGDGTPLVIAARKSDVGMTRLLIEAGADVNKPAHGDGNPMIVSARRGNLKLVKLLVENGADVNGFVLGDETPLIGAAAGNKLDVARFLIENGADVNLAVETGNRPPQSKYRSPLGQAQKYGRRDMVKLLKDHGAEARTERED